ncbi:hypothetical protein GMSM_44340 [Geomonas sp. Red276]
MKKTLPIMGILALSAIILAEMAYADTVVPPTTSLVNSYDPNGNLISGDGKYYEYNDANQLIRVRTGDKNGPVVSEYFYDYQGQRVKKVENGVTTYYVGKYYEASVVSGSVQNTSYFLSGDERIAKKDQTGIYFYHPDHLGGVNAVTNSSGGVVATTSYLPFGEIRQGGAEKYSYTGKEKDKATDLYYFDARYNHPAFRHFTQADDADPDMDDPQDLNRYAYVGNNPMSYVDPEGHKKKHHSKKEEKKLAKARAAKNALKKQMAKEKEKLRAVAHYKKGFGIVENIVASSVFADSNAHSFSSNSESAHTGKLANYSAGLGKELGKELFQKLSEQTFKGISWALENDYTDLPAMQGAISGSIKAELGGIKIVNGVLAPAVGNFLAGVAIDEIEPNSKKVPILGEIPYVGDILFRYTPITKESIEDNGDVYINGVYQGNCNCK